MLDLECISVDAYLGSPIANVIETHMNLGCFFFAWYT